MKYLAILVGSCLALAGCVIEADGVGGNAGDGGAGVGATGGAGGSGGAMGGTGGSVGGTGGTGGAACATCAEFITADNPPELCPGTSTDLFDALGLCICGDGMGNGGLCATQCEMEACAGMATDPAGECGMCIQDPAAGCGTAFNDCANDF